MSVLFNSFIFIIYLIYIVYILCGSSHGVPLVAVPSLYLMPASSGIPRIVASRP